MARLNAAWNNFTARGQAWWHFWQDAAAGAPAGLSFSVAQANDEQTQAIAGKETLQGSVAQATDEQQQAIAGKESLSLAVSQANDDQAQAVTVKESLSLSVAQSTDDQAQAIAARESNAGSVAQSTDEQTQAIEAKETLSASVDQANDEQEQAIGASQGSAGASFAVDQSTRPQAQYIVAKAEVVPEPARPVVHGGGGVFWRDLPRAAAKRKKRKKRDPEPVARVPLPDPDRHYKAFLSSVAAVKRVPVVAVPSLRPRVEAAKQTAEKVAKARKRKRDEEEVLMLV